MLTWILSRTSTLVMDCLWTPYFPNTYALPFIYVPSIFPFNRSNKISKSTLHVNQSHHIGLPPWHPLPLSLRNKSSIGTQHGSFVLFLAALANVEVDTMGLIFSDPLLFFFSSPLDTLLYLLRYILSDQQRILLLWSDLIYTVRWLYGESSEACFPKIAKANMPDIGHAFFSFILFSKPISSLIPTPYGSGGLGVLDCGNLQRLACCFSSGPPFLFLVSFLSRCFLLIIFSFLLSLKASFSPSTISLNTHFL